MYLSKHKFHKQNEILLITLFQSIESNMKIKKVTKKNITGKIYGSLQTPRIGEKMKKWKITILNK